MLDFLPRIAGELLELLYPSRCRLCREINPDAICPSCMSGLQRLQSPICGVCGTSLALSTQAPCSRCRTSPPPFTLCRSLFHYRGEAREAILKLKFEGRLSIAPILAGQLSEFYSQNASLLDGELLVPVPGGLGNSRVDAAPLLCHYLSASSGLPMAAVLEHRRKIKPQHSLGLAKRAENVRDAYRVKDEEKVRGRRAILVDDIITTGATAQSCASELLKAGAARVAVLTLARTPAEGETGLHLEEMGRVGESPCI
jgi:ComF family protein